jgi:adenylate cyclase
MPAEPWLVRNRAVEQPFDVAQIPMFDSALKERFAQGYPRAAGSKAFVISANRKYAYTVRQLSPDEAIRRSLERCGFMASSACMVVALDDTFVIPIPTLAKAIGVYRPEGLVGVRPSTRDEVARRLADAPNAWNAVAIGTNGNVGIALSADSEQSALDGALADCAKHDRNCRIAVLGPFLVEPADQKDKRAATP